MAWLFVLSGGFGGLSVRRWWTAVFFGIFGWHGFAISALWWLGAVAVFGGFLSAWFFALFALKVMWWFAFLGGVFGRFGGVGVSCAKRGKHGDDDRRGDEFGFHKNSDGG